MKIRIPRGKPPLELDFLRPGIDTTRRPLQLALLVCSVPVLALALVQYRQAAQVVAEQSDALELSAGRSARHARKKTVAPAEQRARDASLAQWRVVQARLHYPWQSFLAFLESERQDDVALVAIEPDRHSGLMRIGAEAKDMAAMMHYLARLQASGAFEDAVLSSHELQARRPGTPIRFEVQVRWRRDFPQAPALPRPPEAHRTGPANPLAQAIPMHPAASSATQVGLAQEGR
jgi:hypothetical protein